MEDAKFKIGDRVYKRYENNQWVKAKIINIYISYSGKTEIVLMTEDNQKHIIPFNNKNFQTLTEYCEGI